MMTKTATNSETLDTLSVYMQAVGRYPLLTPEAEGQLLTQAISGDKRATQRLAEHNLRLVVSTAKRYSNGCKDRLLDLIQAGNVGLMESIPKFDQSKATRFSTYALQWIRARVLESVKNDFRLVRTATTEGQRKCLWNMSKVRGALEAQGIEATPERLAEALDVPVDTVKHMAQVMSNGSEVSTQATTGADDSETTVGDQLPGDIPDPEIAYRKAEWKSELRCMFNEFAQTLSAKQRIVLDLRILSTEPLTLQEVADIAGCSRQAVQYVDATVRKKAREFFGVRDLHEVAASEAELAA